MRNHKLIRFLAICLLWLFLTYLVTETRPKAFSTDMLAYKQGGSGNVASGAVWLLEKTGNVKVIEFRDYQFVTIARISILGKEMKFIGLPVCGRFYRIDRSAKELKE